MSQSSSPHQLLNIEISHTVHYYILVSRHTSILAMPRNNTSAISALVLVPIAIIILAIFLALKLSHLIKYVRRLSKTAWDNQNRQSRRPRRSNIPASQLRVRGWLDLESGVWSEAEFELDTFVGQPRKAYSDSGIKCPLDGTPDTLCRRWHRARSARPVWSTTARARYASIPLSQLFYNIHILTVLVAPKSLKFIVQIKY